MKTSTEQAAHYFLGFFDIIQSEAGLQTYKVKAGLWTNAALVDRIQSLLIPAGGLYTRENAADCRSSNKNKYVF